MTATISRRSLIATAAAIGVGTGLGVLRTAAAQTAASVASYQTVFYRSGKLMIEAYLYRPMASGPFPLMIYNHGARGNAHEEAPTAPVGELLADAGYAVLVVEGRGYGKSDGTAPMASDAASIMPTVDDVLASLTYIKSLDFIDQTRLGIMGWSLGGTVTLLTLARGNTPFRVAIDQAGASLSWSKSTALQKALIAATAKIKIPVYFMDAQNDATIDSVLSCAAALQKTGVPHKLTIYPPFFPKANPDRNAPGHEIFGEEGVAIWGPDAIQFLNEQLMPPT